MRTVMVLIESSPHGCCAMQAAFLAAGREGGHIVGIYPVPRSERLTPETRDLSRAFLGEPGDDVLAILNRAEKRGGVGVEAGQVLFEKVATEMGATVLEKPPNPGYLTAFFQNSACGEPHRAQIVLPEGFHSTVAETASGSIKATGTVPLDFAHTYASFLKLHITDRGIVRD